MLGGGELIAAFSDKPEVPAVAKYLTSAEYANSRAKAGNWLSPNKGLDPKLSPIRWSRSSPCSCSPQTCSASTDRT